MTKLVLLVAFLTISVGYISCSQRTKPDAGLEKNLNEDKDYDEEEEEEGDEEDDEAEDSNEGESGSDEVETQIEAPSLRTDLELPAQNNALKDFDILMKDESMRSSLQHISNKLRQLFYEIKTKEAMKNIMRNVNKMQSVPQVNKLIEKTMESFSTIIEEKDSHEIFRKMKKLHQIVAKNPTLGETIAVIKGAVYKVLNNDASMRIVGGGIKTFEKLGDQREAVKGILADTMGIIRDHEKTHFVLSTGIQIAPYFGTLQNLLASKLSSQIDPEASQQKPPLLRSPSVKPSAPARKISNRRRNF